MDQSDDAPTVMVSRTIGVLIVLPSIMALLVGGIVGYSVNGVPGAIGAGVFFGLSSAFAGTFLYWLVGPIETPSWPTIVAALVVVAALIILLVL